MKKTLLFTKITMVIGMFQSKRNPEKLKVLFLNHNSSNLFLKTLKTLF